VVTILSKQLRRDLETAIRQAREIADAAAKEALARIAVADADAPPLEGAWPHPWRHP
jgi:hypothetical protein